MRDVGQHEAPLDDRGGALLQDPVRLASDQCRDGALAIEARRQHGVDSGARQIARAAAVEFHVERIERALGLPEMIGDDADRVVTRQMRYARVL